MRTDFAFAPRGGEYGRGLRGLFASRALPGRYTTTLIHDPSTYLFVSQFLRHLREVAAATSVGDILIGAHSHMNNLRVWLDMMTGDVTDYQDVRDILDGTSSERREALKLPINLFPSSTVHIKGCRIGSSPEFIDALKVVFGGHVSVTAPCHFHEVRPFPLVEPIGWIEYLLYGFRVISLKSLTRDELIEAFVSKREHFITDLVSHDGYALVGDEFWDAWIPVRIRWSVWGSLLAQLGRTIGRQDKYPVAGYFRVQRETCELPSNAATETELASETSEMPQFQSTWGFPLYKQFGAGNLAEFFESFTWRRKEEGKVWLGSRLEYTAGIPITIPPPELRGNRLELGRLVYNFYPSSESTHQPVNELLETNAKLFYTAA